MIEPLAMAVAVLLASLGGQAQAQVLTLREAIAAAYASNPELAEARARQIAREELPIQARSDGRPTLSSDGRVGYDGGGAGEGGSIALTGTLPLWTGGRVASAVRAADADVAAGEQRVRDTESAVIEDVVVAYADLLFAQEAVEITRIGIERLDRQIGEAQLRFDLGEATSTDVAQLRAQRASVLANSADAEASLAAAEAAFRAVVGQEPGELEEQVPPPEGLPETLANARAAAETDNPLLLEQVRIAEASGARIAQERAARAPTIGLAGGYGRGARLEGGTLRGFESAATVAVVFRLPILTGGLVPSRIREAEAVYRAEQFAVVAEAREAIRSVDTAWASLLAARARLDASEQGLEAAELALDGVRAEYEFGLRSTLDILIAEQSYRAAQLALVRSRSDVLIAQAAVLRASGRLEREAYL